MSRGNIKNLVPSTERTPEERREMTIKAGKASGEARRRKKTFQELAKAMLDMDAPEKLAEAIKQMFPEYDNQKISYKTAGIAKQIEKMLKGDLASFLALRDTAGEKPKELMEFSGSLDSKITLNKEQLLETATEIKKLLDE